jgi:hypothetical protein
MRDVLLTQDQFEGNRRLPDLLQDVIEPLPAVAAPAQSGDHCLEEPSLEQQLREQEAAELHPEAHRYSDHADEPGMDM